MLDVQSLDVRYGSITALKSISIHAEMGEFISVIGANGAGKSSLLNALGGVVPAAGGTITFNGRPINTVPPEQRAKQGIALIPEDRGIFKTLSVRENLKIATAAKRSADVNSDFSRVYEMFPILHEYREFQAGQLSGGEQQMLAIGRALMMNPVLLLADEPSLGLAPIVVKQVLQSLKELNSAGVTIVLVEQHALKAIALADRTYLLRTGGIIMEGTRQELMDRSEVVSEFMGIKLEKVQADAAADC